MADKYIDKIKKDGEEYGIRAINGGTKLYEHILTLKSTTEGLPPVTLHLISLSESAIETTSDLYNMYKKIISYGYTPSADTVLTYFMAYPSATSLTLRIMNRSTGDITEEELSTASIIDIVVAR